MAGLERVTMWACGSGTEQGLGGCWIELHNQLEIMLSFTYATNWAGEGARALLQT